jgi:hypothetical protein
MLNSDTEPKPLETVLAFRDDEREHVLAFTRAIIRERAAFASVQIWRDAYGRARALMEHMNPFDSDRMHRALKDAELDAIEEHQAAEADLNGLGSPFSERAVALSREAGQ